MALLTTGLGVVLLPVAAVINRAAAAGHARMAVRLLGPSREAKTQRRAAHQAFAA